jgi:flagellin
MASLINQTLIGGTASVVGGALTITSSATGTSSGVTIVSGGANDASTALGFGSVDVDAHGVDGSAGVATGTAAGPVTITDNTSNNTLQVAVAGVQGGATQTITLTSGAGQNATAIAGQINAQLVGATAAVVGGNLRITSTATGSTSDVTIGATNALGFATGAAGNGSDGSSASSAGTVAGPVTITDLAGTNNTLTVGVAGVNGGAGQKIVLTTGATQTAATIAGQINAQLVGATASVDGVTNKLTITSTATGTTSGVTITVGAGGSGDASQVLGFGASTNTANGVDATAASDQGSSITPPVTFLAANSNTLLVTIDGGSQQTITLAQGPQSNDQIVAAINNQLTAGTGTAFVDDAGELAIASNSTGTTSTVDVTGSAATILGFSATAQGSSGTTGYTISASNDTLTVAVDGGAANSVHLTQGTGISATTLAGDLQTQLRALHGAYSNVTVSATADNTIKISSGTTGTASTIAVSMSTNDAATDLGLAEGSVYKGTAQDVGFGTAGVSFTGNTADNPRDSVANSGGATSTRGIDFTALSFGSDSQAITVSATNASGQLQSTTITLANNDTSRTGRSLDETIQAINTALQQTNNPTLQSVVAVKDHSTTAEKIDFISSLAAFQVSVGSTGSGSGVQSQGSTVTATALDGGSNVDISTQLGGTAAISALTDAVSALGSAQANVGKAQNTLNYAIGLAESQWANLSAAESRIRDADMAAEAANLTKASVLQQSAIAAMVQANSAPQAVLTLLRG